MRKPLCMILTCLLLSMIFIGNLTSVMAEDTDVFGYTCSDSNTSEDVVFNWIEIADSNNQVLPPVPFVNERTVEDVPIGFTFSYYGREYTELSIGLNGLIMFEPQVSWFGYLENQPIMSDYDVNGFIAPYWDSISYTFDYSTYDYLAGTVNFETFGVAPNRYFVAEWSNLNNLLNGTSESEEAITFEAILYEGSNDILFQYSSFSVIAANGVSATVGIEDHSGADGLEYSYNQPVISPGLAIQFEYPVIHNDVSDVYASIAAPIGKEIGDDFQYLIYVGNLGSNVALNVQLNVTLPLDEDLVEFVEASDDGIYDPVKGVVSWDIGSLSEYPLGAANRTLEVHVSDNALLGSTIQSTANISTSSLEFNHDNNVDSVLTTINDLYLPPDVDVEGATGSLIDPPSVLSWTPTVFEYYEPEATSVDIIIHTNDENPDIVDSMLGPAPSWSYPIIFGEIERSGEITVTYVAHFPEQPEENVVFLLYVDPAGYIYDSETYERISGAVVWLQRPNGLGGWENVPTGLDPAVMDPDVNPLITGEDGRYKWDTLEGTYRVHVEASGYYPANSRIVDVPPPVTDLHVGLVRIPLPQENAFPEIRSVLVPVEPVAVNTLVSVSARFVDADIHDTHTAIWTWADGTSSKGTVTEENGVGVVSGGHIYLDAGVYDGLTLTVTDSNGGSVEYVVPEYVVVYDSSAGFVTGRGWINSPEGAYTIDPQLAGTANFGFVSKYQKGANVLTGNTVFEFKVADLKFHSTSYQWLVIAGAKAQYKGTGTINGEGSYTFMLTATDGKLKSELTPDTFRIKIWDSASGNIVYDNQLGLSDSSDPTTAIEGGSIVIHK
ncbi:MAG: hypothetical protein CW691_02590 [Candidatus Bathyarchaeum sp.]|nr:MAG: hypothetical protein CW691_02590 [Candidatus Bathyarchaeum sp.]